MKGIAPHVAREFCVLCDWAYHANQIHRHFFDDNQFAGKLIKSKYGDALANLSIVSIEYALLQITKLHDNAIVSGNITLSIDYVVNYGGWEEPVKSQLESLRKELDQFAAKIRQARNKVLAHNDLASILAGGSLGIFEQNEDIDYFKKLESFADIVSQSVNGKRFKYSTSITGTQFSIVEMMSALHKTL